MKKGTSPIETTELQDFRRRPDPVPFSKFLYNSEKGTVLGRTGTSWGKNECTLIIAAEKLCGSKKNCLNTHTTTRVS